MVLYAWIVMGSQSECVTGELTEGISLLGLRFGYSYESALQLFNLLSSSTGGDSATNLKKLIQDFLTIESKFN